MSVKSRSPLRMAGANTHSGNVNDGRLATTRGGGQRATIWSGGVAPNLSQAFGAVGSGNQVLFWSGAGRLDTVIPHLQMTSGLEVFFYDAATLAGSGVGISGQGIIGLIPRTHTAGHWSGHVLDPWPARIEVGTPFYSGLCASCPSGAPGFTVTFTPEVADLPVA